VIPVEALYQDALGQITADTRGVTRFILELGPFGGAFVGGTTVRLWSLGYLALVGVLALFAFSRSDL
jgi:hypothetical protein